MSSRSKAKGPSKRDAMGALEAMCLSMSLYHAGKGSIAEGYLREELDRMAENIFKGLTPEGMLKLQAVLQMVLAKEAEKQGIAKDA